MTNTPRCVERNADGGTLCRNPVTHGGPCWRHRHTAALRAEVTAWCEWTARAHGVGLSDGETFIGGLVGARGDVRDWSGAELAAALDAAVASLGVHH
jgi:hypothetical protein